MGSLQARTLEWVAMPSSMGRGSSQPRDGTQVSCIAGRFFTGGWATREASTSASRTQLISVVSNSPSHGLLIHGSMAGLLADCALAGFSWEPTGWAPRCWLGSGVLHAFPELGLEEQQLPGGGSSCTRRQELKSRAETLLRKGTPSTFPNSMCPCRSHNQAANQQGGPA